MIGALWLSTCLSTGSLPYLSTYNLDNSRGYIKGREVRGRLHRSTFEKGKCGVTSSHLSLYWKSWISQ